jgi:hypothetical protein
MWFSWYRVMPASYQHRLMDISITADGAIYNKL